MKIDLPHVRIPGPFECFAIDPLAERTVDYGSVVDLQSQIEAQQAALEEDLPAGQPTLSTKVGDFVFDPSLFDDSVVETTAMFNRIASDHGVATIHYLGTWATRGQNDAGTSVKAELVVDARGRLARFLNLAVIQVFERTETEAA